MLVLPKGDYFAFSPDGGRVWLAHTSVNSSTVRGVEVPGGEQFVEFNALPNLRGLACSPDGKRLAASNHWGVVAMYDAGSGKELWKSAKTGKETFGLLYAPDGSMVFNKGAGEGGVRRRDAKTGKELAPLELGEGWLASEMAVSPDGKVLAVMARGGGGKFIIYWDWRAGKELRRERHPEKSLVGGLAFMPGGRQLVTIAYKEIDVWGVSGHKRVTGFNVKEGVKEASLSPGGALIAVNTFEGAQVREMPSGKVLKALDTKERYPTDWAFSPDGRYALLVASPKSFLWEVEGLVGAR
jgi:WD40 repeat protein